MAIEFEQYMPHNLGTGERVNITGTYWDCVSPCVVVGRTIKDSTPVVRGPDGEPKLNSGELLRAGTLRTRGKGGQTPIEVVTLGEYQRISVKHMVGMTIRFARSTDCSLLLITEGKNFVKLGMAEGYDGWEMENARLTLEDLRHFQLIDDDVLAAHADQQKEVSRRSLRSVGKQQLASAIRELGIDEVKRVVESKIATG